MRELNTSGEGGGKVKRKFIRTSNFREVLDGVLRNTIDELSGISVRSEQRRAFDSPRINNG